MKYRITIGIILLTSTVLLLGLFFSIPRFISVEKDNLFENEEIILGQMVERSRVSIITREFSDLQDMVEQILRHPRVMDVIVTDSEGMVIASSMPDLLGGSMGTLEKHENWAWRHKALANSAGHLGDIYVRFSYEEFNQSTRELWSNTLLGALAGISLIAFIAWWYASILTRNLSWLVWAAQRLSRGYFDIDVSIKGESELALLGKSFGAMAAELKQSFQTLRESEQRYKLAAAGTNDGIWEWDLAKNEVYISPRWKSILGYDANESIESSEYWFSHVLPEDLCMVKSAFESSIEGEYDQIEVEFRMNDATNQVVWVSCRGLVHRDDKGKALKLAGSISDITNRKNAENILQQQAMYDGLTGLPNRHLFMDRLGQSLAHLRRDSANSLAVLFIDLDRFKTVNDSLGHAAGDQLLVEMSRRFTQIVRETDTLARFGGDEFVLMINHPEDVTRPEKIARRLCEDAKKGFSISGQTVFLSASIGMVNVESDVYDAESVIRDADVAMYKAKAKGGDCFMLFDRAMHMDAVSQLQISTDLQEALLKNQFELYYQPILDVKSRNWKGFEALIRWNHPERGLMSPVDFIPYAEQSGMINDIGMWVVEQAVGQLSSWTQESDKFKDYVMSINISVKQIDHRLVDIFKQVVERYKMDPTKIQLEITESLVMSDMKKVINVCNELKSFGFQLAMDDFGTGYSSLSYLHRLPFTALKVDRSFVSAMKTRGEHDDDIVPAVIRLAKNFNMKVIAEGVETHSQFLALEELDCEYLQGYLISKPVPAGQISDLVDRGKAGFDLNQHTDDSIVSII